MTRRTNGRNSFHRWWPFVALCVAALLRWNLEETHPEVASTLASQATGCSLCTLGCAAVAWLTQEDRPANPLLVRACVAGALLLAGSELALFLPSVALSASALTLALGLTPAVVAVGLGLRLPGGGVSARLLTPAIAAIAGLLLLLTEPALGSFGADAAMLAIPLLAGSGCVLLPHEEGRLSWWLAASALTGAAVPFVAGAALVSGRQGSVLLLHPAALAFDSVIALLAVLSADRLAPLQYAARFALLPLLALLEGWVLLRPPVNLRMIAGLGLLAVGAAALLRRGKSEPGDEPLSLVP